MPSNANPVAGFVDYMRKRSVDAVDTIIVLGSGLGPATKFADWELEIPYDALPGFIRPGVEGHFGVLLFGKPHGRRVFVFQGRSHMYEGLSFRQVSRHIFMSSELGAREAIITNAAGGVNEGLSVGDLVLIRSHLSFLFERHYGKAVDPQKVYTARLRKILTAGAAQAGLCLREGVYAACMGPSYETQAEVGLLRYAGADCVGMSTLPEVLACGHCSMEAAVVSTITNLLSHREDGTTHDEVMESGKLAAGKLSVLLSEAIKLLAVEDRVPLEE
jgi:purine-nucleoside phosphorylase